MDSRLKTSVRILTAWLGDTIREQEGEHFFNQLEKIRVLCRDYRANPSEQDAHAIEKILRGLSSDQIWKVTRAFTLYFQLVNLAEENQRIHRIQSYERDADAPEPMSVGHAFIQLKAKKVPVDKIKKALSQIEIEPVLTAHPTEAKRQIILQHLMRISHLWENLGDPFITAQKRAEFEASILETLEILWQTSEVRQRKLTVEDEISNTLFFFKKTIFAAAADFYQSFANGLKLRYPELDCSRAFLSFGSWVGGDRDGNPAVTAEMSKQAMRRHRQLILRRYREKLGELAGLISISHKISEFSAELQRSIKRDLSLFPSGGRHSRSEKEREFYRLKIDCMIMKLDRAQSGERGGYRSADDFIEDLELVRESLKKGGSPRTAGGAIERLILEAKTFRFHLAHLDYRFHMEKIRQLALELVGSWPLEEEWPQIFEGFDAAKKPFSIEAQIPLEDLESLRSLQEEYGEQSAHRIVLSMTERAGDVWAALTAAKKAGLVSHGSNGRIASRVDIIPLFETVPDLARAAEIMKKLWTNPTYREILKSRGNLQEIMLGYSDSNKYGGYLSANYNLYKTQRDLSGLARAMGVQLRFFHGKGGSIDRGGGPAHRAIMAVPESVPGFRLRITEQGEVISMKYGHPVIARRNLEQSVCAVLLAGLAPESNLARRDLEKYEAALEELSNSSLSEYRNLVYESFGFKEYFFESSPIDLLERLRIASRSAFRNSIGSMEDLRAIPWVFSWTQNRHMISAWYGIGTALEKFTDEHGEAGRVLLAQMYRRWPFFSSLVDNAQLSLAKADMDIAERYSQLVRDPEIRKAIFGRIKGEYHRSIKLLLAVMGEKTLLEKWPVLKESIRLRNPYVDALHAVQMEFLGRWRKSHPAAPESEKALEILLLATNGIAFGMKSTG